MLDVVLHRGFARRDKPRLRIRVRQIEQPALGCFVIVHRNRGEAPGLQFAERDEEPAVLFLVDEGVVRCGCTETVPIDARGPVIGIEPHVIEDGRVRAPHDRALGVGNFVGQVVAGGEIAHAQRIDLRALVVGRPCEQRVVGRVRASAELEIGLAGREGVAVEQLLLVASVARLAAQDRMLAALPIAHVIGERPVRARHRGVVLLDAPLHLGEQRLLQRLGVRQRSLDVLVLGFEVTADLRIEQRRIAHHLAPVVGAQPRVVIDQRDAMPGRRLRVPLGLRRGRKAFGALEHAGSGRRGGGSATARQCS